MTDLLKRNLAPLTQKAWAAIDEQAARILKGHLSARKVVDIVGPLGWEAAALNLGTCGAPGKEVVKGVRWAPRKVLPLLEVQSSFVVDAAAMDEIDRGRPDPDLAAVDEAARAAALFEETVVYHGLADAGVDGILTSAGGQSIVAGPSASEMVEAIEQAMLTIQTNGIGGPYSLVLGTAPYQRLMSVTDSGYPLPKRVRELLGGDVHWSPAVEGGLLLSRRGGDYELTLGQDLSIGYLGHKDGHVTLCVTESFAFRVLDPAAAAGLVFKKG